MYRSKKRNYKNTQRKRFSKVMCIISTIIFLFTLICGVISCFIQTFSYNSVDMTFYAYAIPASAGLSAATIGFNLNYQKSKKVCKEKLTFIKQLYKLKQELGVFSQYEASETINNQINETENMVLNNLTQQDTEANEQTNIVVG